jgi:hypothetical protein
MTPPKRQKQASREMFDLRQKNFYLTNKFTYNTEQQKHKKDPKNDIKGRWVDSVKWETLDDVLRM